MLPKFPNFKNLEMKDKEDIEAMTSLLPPYSDFNFISLWSWNTKDEVHIAELNGNLVVRFSDYLSGELFYSFLGTHKVNETAEKLLEHAKKEGVMQKLQLLPQESTKRLDQEKFYILESRDHFDYVYKMCDFHAGAGKKYETHRNLLSRFARRHTETSTKVVHIHEAKKEILELSEKWRISKKGKQDEIKLRNEGEAIKRIFELNDPNLTAVCVFHKDTLIAYSISEVLAGNHVLCHFAKADTEFAGIYSFLMKKTCEHLLSLGKEFLNYEQDLGLPHLRFSKSSFHPAGFLSKFSVIHHK
jgi:hypothetical protein